ncbi:MAG: aminotransferase class I/II-fold pyridoxal phosphate-dependent enzyme [Ignavibacteriales bacterium]|jgi:Glutamate decarboxylase and related PLP-dependent proteins|nr:MAG: aminotransferase class I/II-fold pyridoxal phosphate-dependent enzyme [Ignavibacteriaceae bacterium]MBW7872692.1 aminotransferase class I/II-fold pyridoxal phosphate-dependent enzyme [Ignavibacteria bacterium]MCZ2143413.1 aminotransferase class I/II-fold pyridoxal phosphate-dependent enzyme [Ignavibacteriales bacterium]OQY79138.1 MAG: hypothetical protein B6D45_01565 [Ignavibacteriales bacterium UTCHB3]MBV6444292.1 Histidine decarboxylase [Ignavibacteriaceae bacterium]
MNSYTDSQPESLDELLSYFHGPKGENSELFRKMLLKIFDRHAQQRASLFPDDEPLFSPNGENKNLERAVETLLDKMEGNLPFFHPRYSAQMGKDPTIPSILGYLAFAFANPNNHAWEGGPVTTQMEMEVVETLLKMWGVPGGWGHLSSGGSLANMETLWAVRDHYGNGTVFFSEVSHYSWKRISKILLIDSFAEIPVEGNFRMNPNALEEALKKAKKPMMVVANFGSTGTGGADDLAPILELKKKYNFHLHIDAAYGGFFRSVLLDDDYQLIPHDPTGEVSLHSYQQLQLLPEADSITIDPHKQGFIQYGAGAVLYKDEALRAPLSNTAPYTYHKTDKPNIGMFALEGSRPGAMAAACWLTYRTIPPVYSGLGKLLRLSLAAANKFWELIEESSAFDNFNKPDIDIVTFYAKGKNGEEMVKNSMKVYQQLSVENPEAEFIISKFVVSPEIAGRVIPGLKLPPGENFSALRSVFMKHWNALDDFRYVRLLVNTLEESLKLQ